MSDIVLNVDKRFRGCPFCGDRVEFDNSIAVYNRLWQGKCAGCSMMFAYQEEHEPLENVFGGLAMKEVYYQTYVRRNKPFEEVWNERVNDGT